jgi:hypothetical protein
LAGIQYKHNWKHKIVTVQLLKGRHTIGEGLYKIDVCTTIGFIVVVSVEGLSVHVSIKGITVGLLFVGLSIFIVNYHG